MHDLPESLRPELFSQLAAMEDAGIPVDRALTTIAASNKLPLSERARRAASAVAHGRPVAQAGQRSGLFTALEASLVDAVTRAGSPAFIYQRLARYYEQHVLHRRQIKSKMMLPALMLFLAVLLAPLPRLMLGHISALEYLLQTVGVVIVSILLIQVLIRLPIWLRHGRLQVLNRNDWLDGLLLHLPLLGGIYVRRNRTQFLLVLCLLLEAAIPAFEAVPMAARTLSSSTLAKDCGGLVKNLQAGMSLSEAFSCSAWFDGSILLVAAAGEQTGDPGQALCRYAAAEQQQLEHVDNEVASWMPRLVYLAVILLLAWGILQGNMAGLLTTQYID